MLKSKLESYILFYSASIRSKHTWYMKDISNINWTGQGYLDAEDGHGISLACTENLNQGKQSSGRVNIRAVINNEKWSLSSYNRPLHPTLLDVLKCIFSIRRVCVCTTMIAIGWLHFLRDCAVPMRVFNGWCRSRGWLQPRCTSWGLFLVWYVRSATL